MTDLRVRPESKHVPPASPPALAPYLQAYWKRLRGGETGALPGLLSLLVLIIGFTVVKPVSFPSPLNFANLLLQAATYVVVAMGLVFVLLLGEIDLSAAYTAGTCSAVMAVLLVNLHLPWWVSLPAGVLTGTLIGAILGILVAKVGIPSFVVTLSAFLALQGVLLWLVKEGEVILIPDRTVLAISNNFMPVWAGWVFYAIAIGAYAAVQITTVARRARRGLTRAPSLLVALRIGGLALLGGIAVYVLNLERASERATASLKGVPVIVPIVVVLLVILTFVLTRTRFGLHLYALGGNPEAARRAGIAVDRLTIAAFMICSTLAAIGGIILASRQRSADPAAGGPNLLLFAIAAAVIGGTSLFGGRGRVVDAVLGGFVVAVIANGMALIKAKSWVQYVVTGLVLLVAAGVDALARRRSAMVGLR